jgi:hypothetical protein
MKKAVKFDFGETTPAIFAIPAIRLGENSKNSGIADPTDPNKAVLPDENSRNSGIATHYTAKHDIEDDRHYCCECQRLINGRCTASPTRYRPVDTHPRQCGDFTGAKP